jgi:DNA-binding NtrC family response regulator
MFHQRRILLLDQPSEIERRINDGLLLFGGAIEFCVATDAREAMHNMLIRPMDLIVTGISHAAGSAEEFLSDLKKTTFSTIPAIIIADHSQQDTVSRCMSLGVTEVLWQPLQMDMMLKRVADAVSMHARPVQRIEVITEAGANAGTGEKKRV